MNAKNTYHPDPEINESIARESLESEKTDLAAGYQPRPWMCPICSTTHKRGHFGVIGAHRCLKCGYTGNEGVMLDGSNRQ